MAIISACLSAAGLLPMNGKANISFLKNEDELINTLHTHLYPQSDSLSSSQKIKTAAVCFINDTSNCADNNFGNNENINTNGSTPNYNLDDAERCRNEGYKLNSCAPGETPEGFCIYNSNYFEKCTCPAGYKTCELPYYGVGTACGNKYASCKEDTERACKELNSEFTNTCQDGWKIDPNNTCEYDSTYGKCCNLCNGYDYTTIPNGYIQNGEACTDCNGVKKYKIKINPCDGYQDCGSMGPDTGAKSCMSGTQIKYDNCKPCPNLGTLSSCPSPYTCTYEACSNRYYKSGCQSGYDWNASSKTCTAQCASSYRYTCSGTGYAGGVGTACNGKYTSCSCSSPYTWNGYSCTVNCGYKKMWNGSSCVCDPYYYPYSCNGSHESPSGTSCNGKYERCYCSGDYAWDGSNCEVDCGYKEMWDGSSCVCDPSYYTYSCTGSHESPSGNSCNGKYEECSCSTGYGWFYGQCNLCQDNLDDGWTYNSSECKYGYSDYETGSEQECYRTKYKCSECKMNDYKIGGIYDNRYVIIAVDIEDANSCSFKLTVLNSVSTKINCSCNFNAINTFPLSFYKTIYNNLSTINASLSSLGKFQISTSYPFQSTDSNYPASGGSVGGQHKVGTFNMATGQEENGRICNESCGVDLPGATYDYSNSLNVTVYDCYGETCN